MDNMIYLLNITVSGIKSIKKDVHLDFYKKTIDKNFNPDEYRIKAIYGENGSGKSAIITAVKIFQDLIINDNYLNESEKQRFLEEIVNKQTKLFKFNCEYIVSLKNQNIVYSYTVHLGKNDNDLYEIKYEKLTQKNGNYPNSKYKEIFECKDGELIAINLEDSKKEYIVKKTLNLLSAHTMIYLFIINLKHEELSNKMGDSAKELTLNIILCLTFAISLKIYLAEEDQHELYFLRKRLKESEIDKQAVGEKLLEYSENINFFSSVNEKIIDKKYYKQYVEKVKKLTNFIKIFKSELVSIDIDKKENGEQYFCELNLNYGEYSINKEFESTGIKKLIRIFDCFTVASRTGIVFIDEMDSNLNDIYLCKLVEYFMYYGKGQLCFTTHNLGPMAVLKENRNSIDFLSSDNHVVSWTSHGNSSPENCYRNGMIEDSPFNVDSTDFIGIFGE